MTRPNSRTSSGSKAPVALSHAFRTPRNIKNDAKRFGGLSAKQEAKISETIKSARKATRARRGSSSGDSNVEHSVASKGKGKALVTPAGAFAHNVSFAMAPLTTRAIAASPHRVRSTISAAEAAMQTRDVTNGLEGRQTITYPPREEDNATQHFHCRESIPKNLSLQEALIIEDLLNILTGVEGQYIETSYDSLPYPGASEQPIAMFSAKAAFDPSLWHLVERILPLATYYIAVESYADEHCRLALGLTHHALAAAIRAHLRDYLHLITQLELQFMSSSTFTLHRLYFHLQPTLQKMACIYRLICSFADDLPNQENSSDPDQSSLDEDASSPASSWSKRTDVLDQDRPYLRGGEILAVLEENIVQSSGDPVANRLYVSLFFDASQPYAGILSQWVTTGYLNDPHDEFIVQENNRVTRGSLELDYVDEYWEKRYTLKDGDNNHRVWSVVECRQAGLSGGAIIPPCLRPYREKILLAGKYLNVLRECASEIPISAANVAQPIVPVAMQDIGFVACIETAYAHANRLLLRLLIEEQKLLDRLRSLKHYFFLDCGDAFTSFLDHARNDLARQAKSLSMSKMQNLLDIALRNPSSASSNDPYKEDVKVAQVNVTLTEWLMRVNTVESHAPSPDIPSAITTDKRDPNATAPGPVTALTGFDCFAIDYTVRFPLSLVFSRKTILLYQIIFRFLLQLRHAEAQLTHVWVEQAKSPAWIALHQRGDLRHPGLERWQARAFALRTHMLAFVQHMYSYAVGEVLEPRWRLFVKKLDSMTTVDKLLRDHLDFLDTCLKDCMLTNADLLKIFSKMLQTCHMVDAYNSQFAKSTVQAIAKLKDVDGDHHQVDISAQEALLGRFERHFYHHNKVLLRGLELSSSTDTPALRSLQARLASLRMPTM